MYLRTSVEADLGMPGNEAWQILKDFGSRYQLDSRVTLSPITNGITQGLGAEREVVLYDGSSIRQTILDMQEGVSMLIGFTEDDLPITRATAKFTIDPPDQAFCRVSVDITYEPKFGFLGAVVGALYQPTLHNRFNMLLHGLVHFAADDRAGAIELR